jgi:DNA-binding NarL/FixJ family response regulator
MLLRVLLRRLLEEAGSMKVVCEIAQVDTAPNAVEQSNANVLLASPTVTVSECQLLCQRLKHIPSPPSVVSLRIGLTPEGARDLAQGGVIEILDEEVTEQELMTALGLAAIGQPYITHRVRHLT